MYYSVFTIATILFLISLSINAQPSFTEQQIITTDFFWRTPNNLCIADLDGDGDQDVLAANYGGEPTLGNQIVWYENLDGAGTFGNAISIQSENFAMMTATHAADLDGDGDMDFIASDDSEQIAWFENVDGNGNFTQHILTNSAAHTDGIQTADIDLDGDLDIISVSYADTHIVFWFENLDDTGTFSEIKTIYSDTTQWGGADNLAVSDMDGDGDPDVVAVISESDITKMLYFENLGSGNFENAQSVGSLTTQEPIIVSDIDNDNDKDIIIPSTSGLLLFENTNGQAEFGPPRILTSVYTGVVFPDDLDNDGDIDLLWVDQSSRLLIFNNDGNGNFNSYSTVSNSLSNPGCIRTADFDNDGDQDILIGAGRLMHTGSIIWFKNTLVTKIESDYSELAKTFCIYQNYPNPFNPSTTISYTLPQAGEVLLEIFNLLGQKVETLMNEFQPAGEHQLQWNPEDLPSGIYVVWMQADSQIRTMKLVLQK